MSNKYKNKQEMSKNENVEIKTQDQVITELEKENLELQKELQSIKTRSLRVYEDNQKLLSEREISPEMAEMNYQLKMAEKFIKGGAFPKANSPEQCFVILQAGKELGMKPMESLNSLYIVNGKVDFYGANMIAYLQRHGYKIKYEDSKDKCTVTVYKEGTDESYTETADANEQVLKNSRALSFAKENKLRYHAVRKIRAFHLPHLFTALGDPYDSDFMHFESNTSDFRERLSECESIEEVDELIKENKSQFTKSLKLTMAANERKKEINNQ